MLLTNPLKDAPLITTSYSWLFCGLWHAQWLVSRATKHKMSGEKIFQLQFCDKCVNQTFEIKNFGVSCLTFIFHEKIMRRWNSEKFKIRCSLDRLRAFILLRIIIAVIFILCVFSKFISGNLALQKLKLEPYHPTSTVWTLNHLAL